MFEHFLKVEFTKPDSGLYAIRILHSPDNTPGHFSSKPPAPFLQMKGKTSLRFYIPFRQGAACLKNILVGLIFLNHYFHHISFTSSIMLIISH